MRQVHTFDRASQSQKLSRKICLPLHALPFATNEIVCDVINADTALVKVPSSHFARAKPVKVVSCLRKRQSLLRHQYSTAGAPILPSKLQRLPPATSDRNYSPLLPPRPPSSRRSGVSRMQNFKSSLLRTWNYETVSSFEPEVSLNIYLYTLRLL